MKKWLLGLFIVLSSSFASLTTVSADSVPRYETWDLRGAYTINFDCTSGVGCAGVPHYILISNDNLLTGAFSGSGYYVPDPSYTWNISGQQTGNAVTMHIFYTGANPGYYVDVVGNIGANGSMSGTAVDKPYSTFHWYTTTGTATWTNYTHGGFVSSQTDKLSAAHSQLGMPIKH